MQIANWLAVAAAMVTPVAVAAQAKPEEKTAVDLVDLSTPEAVSAALQQAGYRGEIRKYDDGSPYVQSAAGGQPFTVEFYDCKDGHCASLQLQSYYKPEPLFTAALANEWNGEKRFLKLSIDKQGELREWLDFSVKGKLTRENFADVIDWYEQMDAGVSRWLQERRDAAKKAK